MRLDELREFVFVILIEDEDFDGNNEDEKTSYEIYPDGSYRYHIQYWISLIKYSFYNKKYLKYNSTTEVKDIYKKLYGI